MIAFPSQPPQPPPTTEPAPVSPPPASPGQPVPRPASPARERRAGLPSASAFPRYTTCPASLPLETRLREKNLLPPDPGNPAARRGTRIHRHLAHLAAGRTPDPGAHPAEEIQTAHQLWERARHLLQRLFPDAPVLHIEQRLWLHDAAGEPLASGRFDLIAHHPATASALIIDYKTGPEDTPPAAVHPQLRLAAALTHHHHPQLDHLTTAILQDGMPLNLARLTAADLQDALQETHDLLALRQRDPFELGFVHSAHCGYCPCQVHCPRLHWPLP